MHETLFKHKKISTVKTIQQNYSCFGIQRSKPFSPDKGSWFFVTCVTA